MLQTQFRYIIQSAAITTLFAFKKEQKHTQVKCINKLSIYTRNFFRFFYLTKLALILKMQMEKITKNFTTTRIFQNQVYHLLSLHYLK